MIFPRLRGPSFDQKAHLSRTKSLLVNETRTLARLSKGLLNQTIRLQYFGRTKLKPLSGDVSSDPFLSSVHSYVDSIFIGQFCLSSHHEESRTSIALSLHLVHCLQKQSPV